MLKRIIFSMVLLLSVASYVSPVAACSGGPPLWDEWVERLLANNDVVVVGQYKELDDANTNGIFHVQSYLQGSGGDNLVISAEDVRVIEDSRHVGRYHYTCTMVWPKNLTGTYIYFLKRQITGVYTIGYGYYFASPDATNSVFHIEDYDYVGIKLNLADFGADISSRVGTVPQPPTAAPYPYTTPILITTESNQNYLLPVDTTNLVAIPDDQLVDLRRDQYDCHSPCTAYSPNGLDKVHLQIAGSEPHPYDTSLPYNESDAFGQRILFSSTSETYALWNEGQIQLYALWYPKFGYPDNWMDSLHQPVLFNSTPAANSLQFPAVWSADGRTMAFSTDEGLWVWDALTVGYPPKLVIPTHSKVPVARYFSPRGHYLAVEVDGRRYNLDLITGQELPDGYVSPNDRILLVFDTAAQTPTTLDVAYLAPGIRQSEYYAKVQYRKVQWIDNDYFRASITGSSYLKFTASEPFEMDGQMVQEAIPYVVEERFYDTVRYDLSKIVIQQHLYEVPYPMEDVQTRDFIYKNGPGLIELTVDGYSVLVNSSRLISLASVLSSPIKSATWLPSPFYYEDASG